MAGGIVKFKHFKHTNPVQLMNTVQDWVNGETDSVDWVSEFHVSWCEDDGKWHIFLKYVESL